MPYTPKLLTDEQIQDFMTLGAVHLPGALDADLAEHCAQEMLGYMGIDEHDPSTWPARIAKPGNRGEPPAGEKERRYLYSEHAPRLWQGMCDLLGGPERIIPNKTFRSNGVYTLADPEVLASPDPEAAWLAPLPAEGRGGWHVDGSRDWFHHYLDSPQVALLVLILYRDSTRLGGATWYAPESPALVSRYYHDHPVGSGPTPREIVLQCTDFHCAEGKAGDAFLLHPFMMHTGCPSVLPAPRLMENDNVTLAEPMRFDRPSPADHSILERSILHHLDLPSLTFTREA